MIVEIKPGNDKMTYLLGPHENYIILFFSVQHN